MENSSKENFFLERELLMRISLPDSRANGSTKWSIAHQPGSNDDDQPGGATPIAITAPDLADPIMAPPDRIMAPPEEPHRPWLVPSVGQL